MNRAIVFASICKEPLCWNRGFVANNGRMDGSKKRPEEYTCWKTFAQDGTVPIRWQAVYLAAALSLPPGSFPLSFSSKRVLRRETGAGGFGHHRYRLPPAVPFLSWVTKMFAVG